MVEEVLVVILITHHHGHSHVLAEYVDKEGMYQDML